MIRFSCVCSQTFEAPEDQAGTAFQCPVCHRLVDVPTLSELESISTDGTYKIDADPEPRTTDQQLQRVSEGGRSICATLPRKSGRQEPLKSRSS